MGWIDRTTKKRIAKLDEHPELNSDKFGEKMSTLYFAIAWLIVTVLILLLWYDLEHYEIWIFPRR